MIGPCMSCGTRGTHSGEVCSRRRPRCHACREKPTCIQALANGCKPTCLHCYFEKRIIVRVFDRGTLQRIDDRHHEAELALFGAGPAARAALEGTIAGLFFRRAEMAAAQRGAL